MAALDKAGSGPTHQLLGEIEDALSAAVSALMDARAGAQPRPNFVQDVSKFMAALDAFLPEIPDAMSAAGEAIVQKWNASAVAAIRSGHPDTRGFDFLRPVSISFPDATALWTLRDGLQRLAEAVHGLASEERIGKRGSPPPDDRRADHQFVATLKDIFEKTTGKKARSGTNPKGFTQRDRVSGSFGEFVKAVEDEVVRQEETRLRTAKFKKAAGGFLVPVPHEEAQRLADQLRLEGMHHLIQTACATNTGKSAKTAI